MFRIKEEYHSHDKKRKNHYFCGIATPNDENILRYNHRQQSFKNSFDIFVHFEAIPAKTRIYDHYHFTKKK